MSEIGRFLKREELDPIARDAADIILEQVVNIADEMVDASGLVFGDIAHSREQRLLKMMDLSAHEEGTLTALSLIAPEMYDQLVRQFTRDVEASGLLGGPA